ncbi:hypothetical protein RJ55_08731 [Drechmeria coniospora]|nr:hypothetical protein RJ55_08731 [Drechmeria coniospora]
MQWEDYVRRVSDSPTADLTTSLLNVARGRCLEFEIVDQYLKLLRQDASETQISEVRDLREETNIITNEGLYQPAIIPYQDNNGWAFAVAYTDVIHWYNSRPCNVPEFSASGSRQVVTNWTGPKQSKFSDSGVLMLLGIRCIQKGTPHRSQRVADAMVSSFRTRIFVELLCQKLDPTEEDFEQLQEHEREEQSLFFLDATNGMDLSSRQATSAPITPPESGTSVIEAFSPKMGQGQGQLRRMLAKPTPPGSRDATRPIGHAQSHPLFPDILWHSVKRGALGSVFHERYHAVLFYDKMNRLDDDSAIERAMSHQVDVQCIKSMRSMQSQCKFWYDLCNLCSNLDKKYTLLLAVPGTPSIRGMRTTEKQRIIGEIQSRLEGESDPLKDWLYRAEDLCAAIINQELPDENLMIDVS